MKVKSRGGGGFNSCTKLGLPLVFVFCLFSLLPGFYASWLLLSQGIVSFRPRLRLSKSIKEEKIERQYDPLPYGEFGDDFVATIPFQKQHLFWIHKWVHQQKVTEFRKLFPPTKWVAEVNVALTMPLSFAGNFRGI